MMTGTACGYVLVFLEPCTVGVQYYLFDTVDNYKPGGLGRVLALPWLAALPWR